MVIVVANVIATEYRIKREKEELGKADRITCPPCPVCNTNHST